MLSDKFNEFVVSVHAADGLQLSTFGEMDGRVGLVTLHPATCEGNSGVASDGNIVP